MVAVRVGGLGGLVELMGRYHWHGAEIILGKLGGTL